MRFTFPILLLAICSTLACGTRIDSPNFNEEAEDLPPLLQMQSMSNGASVTPADDVDPATLGLQVRVVVQVHDEEWGRYIPIVHLMNARGERYKARTRTEGFDRFAIFENVGVAASVEGIENDWLIFTDVDEESATTDETATFSLSHRVRGVGDFNFPFACSTVVEAVDCEELWSNDNDDCVVLVGDLVVSDTDEVEIPPLPSVVDVQGDVVVEGNPNLRTLRALSQIGRVQGDLRIRGNENLPVGEAQAVVFEIGEENIIGSIVIDDNGGS
ncbi:MAG: hypothetical protein GY822_12570 [Deltaproteobacteria bacterium]|nr:hypothetical protein [Deltaproteobacteria bacterium]